MNYSTTIKLNKKTLQEQQSKKLIGGVKDYMCISHPQISSENKGFLAPDSMRKLGQKM